MARPKRLGPNPLKFPQPDVHKWTGQQMMAETLKRTEGRITVSFSGGKDSVACMLALREAGFTEIVPVYLYIAPGLRFVEEGLTYYEKLWNLRIVRLPHPQMYDFLRQRFYQPIDRHKPIVRWNAPKFGYVDVNREVLTDLGWSRAVPMAVGTRNDDSIFRRAAFRKTGPFNAHRNMMYPVYDLSRADIYEMFVRTQTRLAVDYRLFGRSFDGIDYRFLKPILDHYPDDFERLCHWFPNITTVIARYEQSKTRAASAHFKR